MWRAWRWINGRTLRATTAALVACTIVSAVSSSFVPIARAQTDGIDPASFLITGDDAGAVATMTQETRGEDGQARWVRRQWERDRDSPDATSGPLVLVNTVFVTHDLGAAGQVYASEVAKSAGVPEAIDPHTGPYPFPMMSIGDQSEAVSVCNDCNAKDDVYVHHRAVVRKGPIVSVIYTYGTDDVATQDLATWFAGQAATRIPDDIKVAGPSAPPADTAGNALPQSSEPAANAPASASAAGAPSGVQAVQARPQDLAVKLSEAGKNAKQEDEEDGSDDRSSWYQVRYERPRTFSGYRSGPVTVVSKVFVARDQASAEQIFQEQAKQNEEFPEATEKVGGRFELKEANEIGDQSVGLSACNVSCNSNKEIYLHKRIVSRIENVVSVTYIWGLANEEGVTDANARHFASLVVARIQE